MRGRGFLFSAWLRLSKFNVNFGVVGLPIRHRVKEHAVIRDVRVWDVRWLDIQ